MNKTKTIIATLMLYGTSLSAASASAILYRPTNPIFQPGNSFNGPTFIQIAEVGRPDAPETDNTALTQRSIAETVQNSLLARISSEIFTQIFGDDAQDAGSFVLGDGSTISFINDGTNVNITFTDPTTGVTIITVPSTL